MGEGGEKGGEAQTFESAMRELEGIVHELEAGDTGLEAAIAAYERGIKLKKFCEENLRQAELNAASSSRSSARRISDRLSSASRRSTAMRPATSARSRSRPAEGAG